VPADTDEVRVGRAGWVLADAVAVVEVDVGKVAAAGRIDVASVIAKIRAPDVAVLPAAHCAVAGKEVERCESSRRRNAERQVGAAAFGDVGRDSSRGEAHYVGLVPERRGEDGSSPGATCIDAKLSDRCVAVKPPTGAMRPWD